MDYGRPRQRARDLGSDHIGRFVQWVSVQMRIALRCACLGMTQQLTDYWQPQR